MNHEPIIATRWIGETDGYLELLDQTLLPGQITRLACRDVPTVFEAIRALRVRGAPAIGIAAAYGTVLGVHHLRPTNTSEWLTALESVTAELAQSRPTAVNLFWALERMRQFGREQASKSVEVAFLTEQLLAEAHRIRAEDAAMCRAIGQYGAELLPANRGVLTHCNTGSLATAEYGTALAAIYTAHAQGKNIQVYADETRPLLQGARLTTWELQQAGVPVTLICDNMAATVLRAGQVGAVIVGADRIAANGDAANKIGTYGLAILAHYHQVPFYVAAPSSTFDLNISNGAGIPIEQRDPREVTEAFGRRTAPADTRVFNPAFDVTPAELITALVTERGIIRPVTAANIAKLLG
ncbi:MAG: S-methyl-5-thioribose-1-phosphate isomerase [Pirellulales bacterium]|nr:S-methyl-5-thioribose-1-phosphate isomerase [Pirellulales bacterium]